MVRKWPDGLLEMMDSIYGCEFSSYEVV